MALIRRHCYQEEDEEAGREEDINVDNHADTPIRYVPLDRVYSAASLCVSASGSSNGIVSKKVKARKLLVHDDPCVRRPTVLHVYSRRPKRPWHSPQTLSFYESLIARAGESLPKVTVKTEVCEFEDVVMDDLKKRKQKRRRIGSGELVKLGVDSSVFQGLGGRRFRDCRNHNLNNNKNSANNNINCNSNSVKRKKLNSMQNCDKVFEQLPNIKKWVR